MLLPVGILGTGSILPALKVTAGDLDQRLGVREGTSLARNGIRTRHFANEDETTSAMSTQAICRALAAAGLQAQDLDAILFSGVMSEQPMPSTATLIHRRLNGRMDGVSCFDINASCAGFLKGFEIAASGIQAGLWRYVAVVSAELASKGLNWDDLDTCTLFGDGAGAAILGSTPTDRSSAILAMRSATLSEGSDFCVMRAGGSRFNMRTPPADPIDYLFSMNGRSLLRLIQKHLPSFLDKLLEDIGDVDLIVPHQASAVGLAFLRKHLAELPGKPIPFVDMLSETGNQVSASIPIALDRVVRQGLLQRGQTALLLGTAAGVSLNGIAIRY
jgi:3-oxoacyl-[acyl-carrier-protein] synthase-3